MAWLTQQALRADRLRRAAEAEAELEQRVSLALWRMDTELAPIIAEEVIRPRGGVSASADGGRVEPPPVRAAAVRGAAGRDAGSRRRCRQSQSRRPAAAARELDGAGRGGEFAAACWRSCPTRRCRRAADVGQQSLAQRMRPSRRATERLGESVSVLRRQSTRIGQPPQAPKQRASSKQQRSRQGKSQVTKAADFEQREQAIPKRRAAKSDESAASESIAANAPD